MRPSPTPDRKATVLLLLAIAGCVDAIGLAETGRYFISFMSGNTTMAALSAGYRDWPGAVAPFGFVALFVAGASLGTLIAEAARPRGAAVLLLIEAALLAGAWPLLGGPHAMPGVVLMVVAMGLANIVMAGDGVAGPAVTYATGTLVRIGIGLAGLGRGGSHRALAFECAMWLALVAGGVAGAVARLRFGAAVLVAPAAVLALLGLVELAGRRVAPAPATGR